jgi:putative multicomponent Na+:H+ antiporter subunit B
MNDNSYIYIIIALLPLAAFMVVSQSNPYNALVIRGILGALAALIYTILGAADVALTEALVGTLLAITLYAIAVRSSLLMRVGVLQDESQKADDNFHFDKLMNELRTIFGKRYMRVEVVTYTNTQALQRALMEKEVHATCARLEKDERDGTMHEPYHTKIRIQRIYDIMQTELSSPVTSLAYVNSLDLKEEHK